MQKLALGTIKGTLLLFNKRTQKKITVTGKQTRKIISGSWNNKGYIALGAEDRQITVTNSDGEQVDQFTVKNDPNQIVVCDRQYNTDHCI
jgi:WD repeat-containing protein 19